MILSLTLLLSLSIVASAQSSHKKTTRKKTVHTSTTAHQASAPAPLDNRKIYQWKNGQRSTPTGEEATGINSDNYVAGKKDSALKKKLRKN
jgi:hypothetical protein